jgi:hypothetical protein
MKKLETKPSAVAKLPELEKETYYFLKPRDLRSRKKVEELVDKYDKVFLSSEKGMPLIIKRVEL